jgi:hypothetical protein
MNILSAQQLVRSISKDRFAASIRMSLKDGNGSLTSVGSIWSVLKCDYEAAITFPVFKVSPNHC